MITPEQADEFNEIVLAAAKKIGFQSVLYVATELVKDEGPIEGTTIVAVATRKVDTNELISMLASACEHVEENFLNPQDAGAEA